MKHRRHTYCTNLLHNGADITFIKELAGHADIATTARYYLGVDKQTLKGVVHKYLDYKAPALSEHKAADNGDSTQMTAVAAAA